jgi:2-isopropylmalate synthase
VRVITEHADSETAWGSVGVHQNIIDASWTAVSDGLLIGLIRNAQRAEIQDPRSKIQDSS